MLVQDVVGLVPGHVPLQELEAVGMDGPDEAVIQPIEEFAPQAVGDAIIVPY